MVQLITDARRILTEVEQLRQGVVSTAKEVETKRKLAGAQSREVNERVEDLKACFARLQVEVDAVLPLGTALLPVAWWAMSFTLALGFLRLAVASTVLLWLWPSGVAADRPQLRAPEPSRPGATHTVGARVVFRYLSEWREVRWNLPNICITFVW
jgi:hypothetical protein